MVKLKFILFSLFGLLLFSCSGQKDSSGKNLSKTEIKAIEYVQNHLKKNVFLDDYIVIKGNMPIYFSEKFDFPAERISREKFDHITGGMWHSDHVREMALNSIKEYESTICELVNDLEGKKSERELILILANFKHDDGITTDYSKALIAFDPDTGDEIKWQSINNDIRFHTRLGITAQSSDMVNYVINNDYNLDSLAQTVSDPVLKFILEPVKETNDK